MRGRGRDGEKKGGGRKGEIGDEEGREREREKWREWGEGIESERERVRRLHLST